MEDGTATTAKNIRSMITEKNARTFYLDDGIVKGTLNLKEELRSRHVNLKREG
jgi:hypothetical protein